MLGGKSWRQVEKARQRDKGNHRLTELSGDIQGGRKSLLKRKKKRDHCERAWGSWGGRKEKAGHGKE